MPSDSASAAARPSILGKTSDPVARPIMTRSQNEVALRKIAESNPDLVRSSDVRSEAHNDYVGGHRLSKHKVAMAGDFGDPQGGIPDEAALGRALSKAQELGLQAKVHGEGKNRHLHTQAMTSGRVSPEFYANAFSAADMATMAEQDRRLKEKKLKEKKLKEKKSPR